MNKIILFILLQPLLWMIARFNFIAKYLFGYSTFSGKISEKQRSLNNFEMSAHRLKVNFRAAPVSVKDINLNQFVLSHVAYEDPRECIAKDKNVTLMNIDSKYALFAVVKDGFDVYDSMHGPFIFRL